MGSESQTLPEKCCPHFMGIPYGRLYSPAPRVQIFQIVCYDGLIDWAVKISKLLGHTILISMSVKDKLEFDDVLLLIAELVASKCVWLCNHVINA